MPAARSNSDYCLTELRPGNTFISDYVMKPQQKQSPKKQISPDLKINDAVIVEGIKSAANSAPITRANSDYCLRYLRFGSTYVSDYDHDKMKDMPRKPMSTPQIPKSYDEVVAANQAATKGANNAEGPKRVFSEYCFMEMRGSTWVTGTKEIADEADTKTAVEGQAPVTRVISEYCATFLRCGSIRLSDYVKQPKKPLKQSTLPKAEEEDIKTAVDSTVAPPPPPPQYPKVVINEEANTEEVIADMEGAKTAKEPEEEADADMEGTKTAKEPEQQYHFFRQVTHLYFLEATTPPL